MSYQQYQQAPVHRLNEFVPTYVPHSDFLPNKVVDSNQPELQQWVPPLQFRSPTTSSKSALVTFTPKSQSSSIPTDTFLSELTRTWWSTSPSPRSSSTAGSRRSDLIAPSSYLQGDIGHETGIGGYGGLIYGGSQVEYAEQQVFEVVVAGDHAGEVLEVGGELLQFDSIVGLDVVPAPYELIECLLLGLLCSKHFGMALCIVDLAHFLQSDLLPRCLLHSLVGIDY